MKQALYWSFPFLLATAIVSGWLWRVGREQDALRFELEREKGWTVFSRNFELCLAELVEIQQTMATTFGKPEPEQAALWNDCVPPKNKRAQGLLEYAYAEPLEEKGGLTIKPKFVKSWRISRFERIGSTEDLLAGEQGKVLREVFQTRAARLVPAPADGWPQVPKQALRIFLPVCRLETSPLPRSFDEGGDLMSARACVYGGINLAAFWQRILPREARIVDLEIFNGTTIQEERLLLGNRKQRAAKKLPSVVLPPTRQSLFHQEQKTLHGSTWTLRWHTTAGFDAISHRHDWKQPAWAGAMLACLAGWVGARRLSPGRGTILESGRGRLVPASPVGASRPHSWLHRLAPPLGISTKIGPALAVFVCGLTLTWFYYSGKRHDALQRDKERFDLLTVEFWDAVETRLEKHEQLLHILAEFLQGAAPVGTPEFDAAWKQRIDRLNLSVNYPGLTELGFAETIADGNDKVSVQVRKRVWTSGESAPVGDDLATLENLPALGVAEEHNRARITARILIPTENTEDKAPGIRMFVPLMEVRARSHQIHLSCRLKIRCAPAVLSSLRSIWICW